jgi:hypothetical protein
VNASLSKKKLPATGDAQNKKDGRARARIYRPSFHENKPKTIVFSNRKQAFWTCFRENWVYKFGWSDPPVQCWKTIVNEQWLKYRVNPGIAELIAQYFIKTWTTGVEIRFFRCSYCSNSEQMGVTLLFFPSPIMAMANE